MGQGPWGTREGARLGSISINSQYGRGQCALLMQALSLPQP